MRKLLYKNSLSGIIQLALTAILTFTAIPIFINKMGMEAYGIFSLITIIGSLKTFMNLGLNVSLVKFLASQGRSLESNYDIIVSIILVLTITIPITFCLLALNDFILINILSVPDEYLSESKFLFTYLVISNFFLINGQIYTAIINSTQNMYISNILKFVYTFLYWTSLIFIVLKGYGLKEIGIGILFASTFWFILNFILAIRLWGKLNFENILKNLKRITRKLINYSIKTFTARVLTFLYEPLTKILISNLIGINEIGYYDIAVKVKQYVVNILGKPFEPLYPYIAKVSNKLSLIHIIHDIEQKSIFLVTPIIVIIWYLTADIITLWLGNINPLIIEAVKYICIFHMIGLTTTPNYQYLIAKGHPEKTIYLQLTNVVLNLGAILLLHSFLSFYAVIIASCLSIIGSFSLNLYYQNKYLKSLIFNDNNQLFKLILVLILIFVIGYSLTFIGPVFLRSILIVIVIPLGTLFFYRYLRLIVKSDIYRYIGNDNYISIKLQNLFLA